MKHFLYAFLLSCKQQLRSPKAWLMTLLLPLLILLAATLLPAEEEAAPVEVGVCLPETGGQRFWNGLKSRSGTIVTFHLTDLHTLKGKVATGQWDCGLVLAEDFDRHLETLDTNGILTLYTGASSVAYPLVQETAACVIMELISPAVAHSYALENGISSQPLYLEALTEDHQVLIQMETLSGKSVTVEALAESSTSRLLLGLIALFLMIWALFSAMDLGSWAETAPAQRLRSVCSPMGLLLPRVAAACVAPLLSADCSLLLLNQPRLCFPALAAYLFTLYSAALLLCRWKRVRDALPCLMPFIAVISLLLSPMVFDLSALYPGIAAVSAPLPMTLFLSACGGSSSALGFLFLEGTLLFLIACLPRKR